MPFVDDPQFPAPTPAVPTPPEVKSPTWGELWDSAFTLENPVVNAVDLATRPAFEPEEGFEISDMWDTPDKEQQFYAAPHRFYGVNSRAEYEARLERIAREEEAMRVYAQGGWRGVTAGLVAGSLSPTMLMPLIGAGARGYQAMRQGFMLGAAAGAIDATVLQMAQADRGTTDTLLDVGAAGILGALLGPLAGRLEAGKLARFEADMAGGPDTLYGPTPLTPGHNEPSVIDDAPPIESAEPPKGVPVLTREEILKQNRDAVYNHLAEHHGANTPSRDLYFQPVTKLVGDSRSKDEAWIKANEGFRTQRDAVYWIANNSSNPAFRMLASRISHAVPDHPWFSVRVGDEVPRVMAQGLSSTSNGMYVAWLNPKTREPTGFGAIGMPVDGLETTALHELLHAATRYSIGLARLGKGNAQQMRMLQRIEALQTHLKNMYDKDLIEGDSSGLVELYIREGEDRFRAFLDDPDELITYALTEPSFVEVLKRIELPNKQTAWSFFVNTMRALFNIPKGSWTALDEILDILDEGVVQAPKKAVAPKAASAGAAVAQTMKGSKLKGIAGTQFQGDFVSYYGGKITESPVVQVLNNPISDSARWFMAQLSNAGLVLDANTQGVVVAPGGTVENRAKAWYTGLARAVKAIDDAYAEYLGTKGPFRNTRSVVTGAITPGKLSHAEFKVEISRAMREGDLFEGPPQAAKVAKQIREFIYEPMTKEAVRIGLIDADAITKVVGDLDYLNRVYNQDAIKNNRMGFIRKIATNFERKLSDKMIQQIKTLKGREETTRNLIDDLGLSGQELAAAREQFKQKLMYYYGTPSGEKLTEVQSRRQMISNLQRKLTRAGGEGVVTTIDGNEVLITPQYLDTLRQQIADLEAGFTDQDIQVIGQIKALEKRMRNLNRSIGAAEKEQARKLAKVDRIYENQVKTLQALVNRINRLQRDIDRLDEKELVKKLIRLREQYDRVVEQLNSNEARARDLGDRSPALEATVEKRYERMAAFRAKLDDLEELLDNREELVGGIKQFQRDAYEAAVERNNRRALRAERLREQAEAVGPDAVKARIKELENKMQQRRLDFMDRWRQRGADDIDFEGESGDFKEFAEEAARTVTDRILGTYNRLPGMDIIQDVRGPELARVLDIPSREIEEFLNNDVEYLMRTYMRTLGSDIEMFRKFGSVDAKEMFRQVELEFEAAQDAAQTEAEKIKVRKMRDRTVENLQAVVGRLRHEWGVPANPEGFAARAARVAQNVNTLRFMGFVTVSSLPDMARLVQVHGLRRTMKNALIPMIRDFKNFQLSAKEARLAGTALDIIIHTRAHQMMDVLEDYGNLSRGERALEFATSRMGLVAAFDYWTTGMKQLAAVAANAEFMEAIMDATKAVPSKRATELLAQSGLDANRIINIRKLVEAGGGGKVNDVWFPNTESWLDPEVLVKAGVSESDAMEALNSYRAALAGSVDSTIITPGVERPLWMDGKSLTLRLIGQFRSFAFSSATKTVMAGMQRSDMAFFNGMMISLALGGLSYYIWANLSGERARTEMQNAGLDKWIDEMIQRSGLQATFAEVQKIAEAIPMTSNYASFSGQRSTRRGGGDLADAVGGPTLDLIERISRVISQIDDPTMSTLSTGRSLFPYQNVFWAKGLYDLVEESAGNAMGLPETRR